MRNTTVSEADILEKLLNPQAARLSADAARFFLKLKFDGETTKQIRRLLRRNNRGTISTPERVTLENYLRVGILLDLLRARAKVSLKDTGSAA
jgi:hypothetical protein